MKTTVSRSSRPPSSQAKCTATTAPLRAKGMLGAKGMLEAKGMLGTKAIQEQRAAEATVWSAPRDRRPLPKGARLMSKRLASRVLFR